MTTASSSNTPSLLAIPLLLIGLAAPRAAEAAERPPHFRTLDLDLGETARVELDHGRTVQLRLVSVDVTTDPIRGAVRSASVQP